MEKGEDRKIQPELLKTEAEVCQTKTKELRHSHTPKAGRISLTFPSFIVLGENVTFSELLATCMLGKTVWKCSWNS